MAKTQINCLRCGHKWADNEDNPGPCPGCEDRDVLHEKERNLIKFIRELQFGEVTIKVQDGLPVMIEKAKEKVKL